MENKSCILNLPNGRSVLHTHCPDISDAIETGCIDGMVVEGTWGFNDLGGFGRTISEAIQMGDGQIRDYSRRIELENGPTVIGIGSMEIERPFKGISLVPTENSACYKNFAVPFYGRPSRDFYYNVVYEALRQLSSLGCRNIGIAGITGSLIHCESQDLANCVAEAVAHFSSEFETLEKVVRVGNGPDLFVGLKYFNDFPDSIGEHRPIDRTIFKEGRVLTSSLKMHSAKVL